MDIRQRGPAGERISAGDPEYSTIIDTVMETMQPAHAPSRSPQLTAPENRILPEKIFGHAPGPSTAILPPFCTGCGKNATTGRNVRVQQGCTFPDRGGIMIGGDVSLAPNVSLITLTHHPDPRRRSQGVPPVHICGRVRIGAAGTVPADVTTGGNSLIGANFVKTHNIRARRRKSRPRHLAAGAGRR